MGERVEGERMGCQALQLRGEMISSERVMGEGNARTDKGMRKGWGEGLSTGRVKG